MTIERKKKNVKQLVRRMAEKNEMVCASKDLRRWESSGQGAGSFVQINCSKWFSLTRNHSHRFRRQDKQ